MDGKLLKSNKVNWDNGEISIAELQEAKKKQQKKFDEMEPPQAIIDQMGYENAVRYKNEMIAFNRKFQKPISKAKPKPYFSTFIKDSDNNLLFFEYPEEEGKNKFNVYTFDDNGKFVCQSAFVCDDYNLVINNDRLIFKDGYLYGIQVLKEADGIPMRLVKFKLSN